MHKAFHFAVVALCGLAQFQFCFGKETTSDADVVWRALHASWPDRDDTARRRFRKEGAAFANRFPEDPRRWVWLNQTLMWRPRNQSALEIEEWLHDYTAWRAEMLVAEDVDSRLRNLILFHELQGDIEELDIHSQSQVSQSVNRVWEFCSQWTAEEETPLQLAEQLLLKLAGAEPVWKDVCLRALEKSPNVFVREMAKGRQRAMRLTKEPLEMEMTMMDGSRLRLSDLRGKVVLVDFWSTYCKSCLSTMERIKDVYDRYEQSGFEVVGVCFNRPAEHDKVDATLTRLGVRWPNSIQGAIKDSKYARELGIVSVPVTYLLDKDGLLVTTDINHGIGTLLESEVRRLLGLPPLLGADVKPGAAD